MMIRMIIPRNNFITKTPEKVLLDPDENLLSESSDIIKTLECSLIQKCHKSNACAAPLKYYSGYTGSSIKSMHKTCYVYEHPRGMMCIWKLKQQSKNRYVIKTFWFSLWNYRRDFKDILASTKAKTCHTIGSTQYKLKLFVRLF